MKTTRLATVLAFFMFAMATMGAERKGFIFLKTGEKFATQEIAGPTVASLTDYLGKQLGDTNYEPRVFNDPASFLAASAIGSKPAVGIVTPGFYLEYAKTQQMEPLLETKRAGVKEERYVLIARKDASDDLSKLGGKTIATSLASEQRYVIGVILRGKSREEIRLKQIADVEGAVFDLVEGVKNAADAVLMEAGAWTLFKDDPELGQKLKVVYQSEELPRDLVVIFGLKDSALNADKLKSVLKGMKDNEDGQKILRSIRVECFVDVDAERLAKAQKLFVGK